MAFRIRTRSFMLYSMIAVVGIILLMLSAWTDFSIRKFVLGVLRNYHLIRPEEDPLTLPVNVALPKPVEGTPETPRYRRVYYERFAHHTMPPEVDASEMKSLVRVYEAVTTTLGQVPVDVARQFDVLRDLQQGQALDGTQWGEVRQAVEALKPMAEEMYRSALNDHLRADQFFRVASDPLADTDAVAANAMTEATNAFCLLAFENLAAGKSGDAMEQVGRAAEMIWQESVASMPVQVAQNRALRTIGRTWARIACDSDNPMALDFSLGLMNDTARRVQNRLSEVSEPLARHLLSRIRSTGRDEIIKDIQRTTPDYLLELYEKARKAQIDEDVRDEALTPERAEVARKRAEAEFKDLDERVQEFMIQQRRWADTEDSPTTMILTVGKARELSALAEFDIARVYAALKLSQRANPKERPIRDLDMLTPRYMSIPPIDLFNEKLYAIDSESGVPYSFGPDQRDQKMQVQYDPTNGTTSAGDIFIEWLRR